MSGDKPTQKRGGVGRLERKWLLFALVGVVVLVVVVVLAVVLIGRENTDDTLTSDTADSAATEVTSPYDFTELPATSGPPDVADSSYVSILLVEEGGQLTSYGLNADMPAAQALKTAVLEAEPADDDLLSSLTTVPSATSEAGVQLGSTLTFVFPDRTTLTFDLYVEHGLVARDGRAWRVEGDLPLLIEAAASAGGQ